MTIGLPNLLMIRTAATELDSQGRICGQLDVPLSEAGMAQTREIARELADRNVRLIYRAPSTAASQTAELLASKWRAKIKVDGALDNIDFGLWHGRRFSELKACQPKLIKNWIEHPESVCPPGGESLDRVQSRVRQFLVALFKKHVAEKIALVVPPPIAAIICAEYQSGDLGELWSSEPVPATWYDLSTPPAPISLKTAEVPRSHMIEK